MSARTDVLLWAQRVVGRKGAAAHQILEIAAGAGLDIAQAAFHKMARMAHPDLHRTTLSAEELELVTMAYGIAAASYQEIRVRHLGTATARIRAVQPPGPRSDPAIVTPGVPPAAAPAVRPVDASDPPAAGSAPPPPAPAAPPAMTAKALLYYRKAELSLRRGDLTEAVLQLKMAIASDPQSSFLRTALTQVQTEIRKKP
jgi:hypothetical protein